MAYFRVRGTSITLLHGFREDSGQAKRIKTSQGRSFEGGPDSQAWSRLQIEVEQKHPDCSLDWQNCANKRSNSYRGCSLEPPPPGKIGWRLSRSGTQVVTAFEVRQA